MSRYFFQRHWRHGQVPRHAGQRQRRTHTRAQHLGKQANGVNLLYARELQHIVTHQAIKVLPAPALGLFVVGSQTGLGKAAPLKQMGQRNIGGSPGLFAPFTHRQGMQPQTEEAPGQRFATLPEGVHARAARHQQLLGGGFAIDHAFDPGFTIRHLVDFIQHQHWCLGTPALAQDQRPVGRHVVVEVLAALLRD